jgi:23S rRNA pseudouridine1911/1915/1917 synthase
MRDGRARLGPVDRVALGVPRPAFPAELRLVHEDDQLLVIDKPAGLLTVATERQRDRTAYRLLWDYLAASSPPGRPFVVHRLDRETSGLLVVAKRIPAKRALQAQFEARSVERVYLAVVQGHVRDDRGTLTGQLVTDSSLRVRQIRPARGRDREPRGAKEAITHYRVLQRGRDTTLLELALGTGRRRQIRVQLAALGHPIVGDADHGGRPRGGRLQLHASRLGFVHPATRAPMRFESPPPPGFGLRAGRV